MAITGLLGSTYVGWSPPSGPTFPEKWHKCRSSPSRNVVRTFWVKNLDTDVILTGFTDPSLGELKEPVALKTALYFPFHHSHFETPRRPYSMAIMQGSRLGTDAFELKEIGDVLRRGNSNVISPSTRSLLRNCGILKLTVAPITSAPSEDTVTTGRSSVLEKNADSLYGSCVGTS